MIIRVKIVGGQCQNSQEGGAGGGVAVSRWVVAPGVLRINIGQSPSPVNYPNFESLAAVNYPGRVRAILRNL